jgi:hypothetical protein
MKEISKKESADISSNITSNVISFSKLLDTISDNNPDKLLQMVMEHLRAKYKLSDEEIFAKLSKKGTGESIIIPIEIFATDLSPAESLVKYLKEEFELGYHEIASLINRDERGIWGTYRRASSKMDQRFSIKEAKLFVPISIFKERNYSILENAVKYMIDHYKLTTYKIAQTLNKKPGTIWSVYSRVKQK